MLETILWILVVVVAVLLGVYAASVLWLHRADSRMKKLFADLRSLVASIDQVRASGSTFTPEDPEPFGSKAKELSRRIMEVEAVSGDLVGKYTESKSVYRRLSNISWPAFLKLPFDVIKLRSSLAALKTEAANARTALDGTSSVIGDLNRMGWTVAERARKAIEDVRSALSILSSLQTEGIDDPQLDTAIARGRRWENTLNAQSPVIILSGTEEEVLREASKDTVIAVYRLSSEARPDIDDLSARAIDWQNKQSALKKLLKELPENYRVVSGFVQSLESAPELPIQWDMTREPLSNARQQIERLGDIKKTRSIEQLENEKPAADELNTRLKELNMRAQAVLEKHKHLLELLHHPDILSGVEWLRSMVKTAEAVDVYAPDNWQRDLDVETLRPDLEETANLHRSLQLTGTDRPLLESSLDELLEKAGRLAALHENLRPRAASIQSRLKEMETAQKESLSVLTRTRALLNQASAVVASSSVLGQSAVEEVDQLRQGLEPLAVEFDYPGEGTVDRKVQRAEALIHKTDQAARRWRERLERELESKKGNLANKVTNLREIALLDDPVVIEAARFTKDISSLETHVQEKGNVVSSARRMLGRLPGFGDGHKDFRASADTQISSGKELDLSSIVNEIKHMNEEYENCSIVLKKVEEVEKPVLDAYEAVSASRQEALQLTSRANELMPESKTWPPTNLSLVNEFRQLSVIEKRWEALKETPVRAIQLVSSLSSLSVEYRALAGNIRTMLEKGQQEQAKIIDLEKRLDASEHEWERISRSEYVDRSARDEIQDMIASIHAEESDIREKYLNGSLSYNQALQHMRMLVQRLDGAQIALEDGTYLDLTSEE